MGLRVDLFDGKKIGKLVPLMVPMARATAKNGDRITVIRCLCDCGKISVVRRRNLVSGNTKSCGCGEIYARTQNRRTHGMTDTPEYITWMHIQSRCHNPQNIGYKNYGGRGITVCQEWRDSFEEFYAHIGPKPSAEYSIDRIDNSKGYEPGNVRWATRTEQANNKRNNRKLIYKGKSLTISQWARETGFSVGTLEYRVKRGWSIEETLTVPVRSIRHGSKRVSERSV